MLGIQLVYIFLCATQIHVVYGGDLLGTLLKTVTDLLQSLLGGLLGGLGGLGGKPDDKSSSNEAPDIVSTGADLAIGPLVSLGKNRLSDCLNGILYKEQFLHAVGLTLSKLKLTDILPLNGDHQKSYSKFEEISKNNIKSSFKGTKIVKEMLATIACLANESKISDIRALMIGAPGSDLFGTFKRCCDETKAPEAVRNIILSLESCYYKNNGSLISALDMVIQQF